MNIVSLHWVIDSNHDGQISLVETWHTLQWLYKLPGNLFIEGLGHIPAAATTFHIHATEQAGYYSLNSWFTALFSLFFWLFVLVQLAKLKDVIKRRLAYRREQRPGRVHAKASLHHHNM
jgi:hypothetical protein